MDVQAPTMTPNVTRPAERRDQMLSAIDVGLWYCDLPFDVLEWDTTVKRHFWLPPDAVVTIETFYERLHPKDRQRTRDAIAHSIASHAPYDIEYRAVAAPDSPVAGQERWIRAIGYTRYDDAGKPIRFDGVTVDITAQKHAAEALAESEARFRNMADNAPVMIWITDATGACVYLNRQWYAFTGQRPEDALGSGWLGAVHPDDKDVASATFLDAHARQDSFRVDYRIRRADGVYRWAVDAASPRISIAGEFLGYIGSVIDIHERKESEAERLRLLEAERAARAEAERANRAKSDFLAVMSHELRTPLNAIDGYAELLEMGVAGDLVPTHAEYVARIRRSQRHLLGLINSVLNFARIEAGHVDFDIRPVAVADLLASAEPLLMPQLAARLLAYRVVHDDQALVAKADPEKVLQILLNLVSNAVKFTQPGGSVVVHAERDGTGAVAIRVTDTGVGIPPDKLDVVFDPFMQVDARLTREQAGAGLGLAISRDLARGMGGELTVESRLGHGSTFILTLPPAS
ncbi:MAG TPA: ATP-binding protein [Gemmatimonadaceae bacterium]|nr:ATP-binding protein [Gemmatimonadaceae bacterium]